MNELSITELELREVELEIESLNNAILAAENWSKEYEKDPDTHAKLIKTESRLETDLRRYFKELSERVVGYINWFAYVHRAGQIAAASDDFTVDVLIADDALGKEDSLFIQTIFDPIAQAIALGVEAGEKIYVYELGISQTSEIVQKTAKDLVADLVGKKIDNNGNVVDNPKAKYRISDKTRADIRQSISTSLTLGEDQQTATARLVKTIKDPKRAAKIAQTETVNSYQKGLLLMGKQSGAIKKEWQYIPGACAICVGNGQAGEIGIDEAFPSGHQSPSAHPGDRCGLRLVYAEEINARL